MNPKHLLALETGEVIASLSPDYKNYYSAVKDWIRANNLKEYTYNDQKLTYEFNSQALVWAKLTDATHPFYIPQGLRSVIAPFSIEEFKRANQITQSHSVVTSDGEVIITGVCHYTLRKKYSGDFTHISTGLFRAICFVAQHQYGEAFRVATCPFSELVLAVSRVGLDPTELFGEYFAANDPRRHIELIEEFSGATFDAFIGWCFRRDSFLVDLYQDALAVPEDPIAARKRLEVFKKLPPSGEIMVTWLVWLTQLGFRGEVPLEEMFKGRRSAKFIPQIHPVRLMRAIITLMETTDRAHAEEFIKVMVSTRY